jgi:endonuclease/exonuclease/phosphatase family metal-dependent hydrolase
MPAAQSLQLLSCNIQAGSSTRGYQDYLTRSWSHVLPTDKSPNLDRIASVISGYDCVGLQESDAGSLRSGFTHQTDYLAQRAEFGHWHHQSNRRVARIVGSGNAVLSRAPIVRHEAYALPGRIPGRGVLLAHFGEGAESWSLAVTHLSLGVKSRHWQLGFLAELLAGRARAVLMGDFNCEAESAEMRVLWRRTALQPPPLRLPTFPSWAPRRALDHVLVAGFEVLDYRTVGAAESDHLGIAVRLA